MIARCRNAVVRDAQGPYFMPGAAAPGDDERLEMERRAAEIELGLRCATVAEIGKSLAELFLMFPSLYWTDERAQTTAAVYAPTLAHVPLWAIRRAHDRVVELGLTRPPAAPEFRKMAVSELSFAYDELADIKLILSAESRPPESPASRAKGLGCARALLAELDKRNSADAGRLTREQAEAAVASGFPHLKGGVQVGAALKKALQEASKHDSA